jgi:hypothetical protein
VYAFRRSGKAATAAEWPASAADRDGAVFDTLDRRPDEAWRVGRSQPAFIAQQEPAALSTGDARAGR